MAVAKAGARAAEGERLRALHHGARAGLRRLSRGPRACRSGRAAQRLSHLPVGGARSSTISCRCRANARPKRRRASLDDIEAHAAKPSSHDESGSVPVQAAPPAHAPRHGGCSARSPGARLGVCAWFVVQFAVIIGFLVWRDTATPGTVDMQQARERRLPAGIRHDCRRRRHGSACRSLAAHRRKWRARDYLALVPAAPRRGRCSASRASRRC